MFIHEGLLSAELNLHARRCSMCRNRGHNCEARPSELCKCCSFPRQFEVTQPPPILIQCRNNLNIRQCCCNCCVRLKFLPLPWEKCTSPEVKSRQGSEMSVNKPVKMNGFQDGSLILENLFFVVFQ